MSMHFTSPASLSRIADWFEVPMTGLFHCEAHNEYYVQNRRRFKYLLKYDSIRIIVVLV